MSDRTAEDRTNATASRLNSGDHRRRESPMINGLLPRPPSLCQVSAPAGDAHCHVGTPDGRAGAASTSRTGLLIPWRIQPVGARSSVSFSDGVMYPRALR